MDGFVPGFRPPEHFSEAYYVVFSGGSVLCGEGLTWRPLDTASWRFSGLLPRQQHFIGHYRGKPCFSVEVEPTADLPGGYRWASLRGLLAGAAIGEAEFAMVGCGLQVFNWDRTHQYCGQCGGPTVAHAAERARICERCELNYYPRLSPCVIVLVTRGDQCLLARHAKYAANFYSPLAGFIEAGESIEGALRREVKEEVGLQVRSPRYFASQPWPFPGQLMVGFHAEYAAGDLMADPHEIEDARWWHYKDLPLVPPAGTLSGMLIRHFVDGKAHE